MTEKISDNENEAKFNEAKFFEEGEQDGRGEIWVACTCLGLSLMCSGLWMVLLVSPR